MTYDQFKNSYPNLANRYFPDLNNKSNALSALKSLDSDPLVNLTEKAALKEYIGRHTITSDIKYKWCEECQSMIGYVSHTHCPFCTYPSIPFAEGAGHDPTCISSCGLCGACCQNNEHYYCSKCKVHNEKSCRFCNKCEKCCDCLFCSINCHEMQECTDCARCLNHCSCDFEKKGVYVAKPNQRKLFDCKRLVGVEWEYNRLNNDKWLNYWMKKGWGVKHEDASCGYEAVTQPIAGDNIHTCLTLLGKVFEKSQARVDNKCSIHVHADAHDLTWSDMFRFLKLYSILEPVLYIIAGQERLENRYCIPCGKDYSEALNRIDRKDAIMAVAFTPITRDGVKNEVNITPDIGRNAQRAAPGKRADTHINSRRKALNILPWLAGRGPRPNIAVVVPVLPHESLMSFAHRNEVSIAEIQRWNKLKAKPLNSKFKNGTKLVLKKRVIAPDTTVEFRIHSGTLDTTRVINWAMLIARLVDWVANHSDNDLKALPKSALRIMCEHIAPDLRKWILSMVKEWKNETSISRGKFSRKISIRGGKYSY